MQLFGIQADELWSFVQKKKNKRWIWVAYDPVHRLVVAYHIGGRGKKAAKAFWDKIPAVLKNCFLKRTIGKLTKVLSHPPNIKLAKT